MATPQLGYRGDVVVAAAFDPASPTTYTNFCAATNITLTLNNDILSEKVGDCDDWAIPVTVVKSYGAQNATMSFTGQWSKQNNSTILRLSLDQLVLPIMIEFVGVPSGEIQYLKGEAFISSIDMGQIGNVEGNAISRNMSLEFSGALEVINAQ